MKHVKGARGQHLFDELRWVHDGIRRDLRTCRALAEKVRDGAAPILVRDGVRALQTNGPLWQLRMNCLSYCAHVHMHHGAEDALLFPGLRRMEPGLGPVIERLEADHRIVSDILDRIEAAANALDGRGDATARTELAAALERLSAHLLEHLDFEESALRPTILGLAAWPY
jgi:hypothetical protein